MRPGSARVLIQPLMVVHCSAATASVSRGPGPQRDAHFGSRSGPRLPKRLRTPLVDSGRCWLGGIAAGAVESGAAKLRCS